MLLLDGLEDETAEHVGIGCRTKFQVLTYEHGVIGKHVRKMSHLGFNIRFDCSGSKNPLEKIRHLRGSFGSWTLRSAPGFLAFPPQASPGLQMIEKFNSEAHRLHLGFNADQLGDDIVTLIGGVHCAGSVAYFFSEFELFLSEIVYKSLVTLLYNRSI